MNKLLVITGGTKGIGRAVIEKFALEGFDIITCARNDKDLKQLTAEITSRYPSIQLLPFKADLAEKEQTLAFASFIKEQKRSVEVLINNTGVFIPGQIHKEKEGTLEQMIQTNLYSAYHLSRALLEDMIKNKHGYIFNICSTASIMPHVNVGCYFNSK